MPLLHPSAATQTASQSAIFMTAWSSAATDRVKTGESIRNRVRTWQSIDPGSKVAFHSLPPALEPK
jgi:hypothetical protein